MIPVNNKVIVRVDMAQKNSLMIAGIKVSTAFKYEKNYREKSPVIAQVVDANDQLHEGDFLLCHHNHFYSPSPYQLEDDLFSIPANHTIFAILSPSGELSPVYGNVLAEKVEIKSTFSVPPEYRQFCKDRGIILDGGWTDFRPGDLVFTRPSAIYEIVYIWGDVEHRVCKIDSRQICAMVKSEEKK